MLRIFDDSETKWTGENAYRVKLLILMSEVRMFTFGVVKYILMEFSYHEKTSFSDKNGLVMKFA